MSAVTFTLGVAVMVAKMSCPVPVDEVKLAKMLTYTTRPYIGQLVTPETRNALVGIGQHAANYACRKKVGERVWRP